jgi:hypothetical protein
LTISLAVPVFVPLGSPAACSSADGPLTGSVVSAAMAGGVGAVAAGADAELCANADTPHMSNAVITANKHGLNHAELFIAYLLVRLNAGLIVTTSPMS